MEMSMDGVVEHRKACAYSHNPVVWPSGNLPADCLVAPGAIHCYAQSPAGSRVSCGTGVAYRHVHTLWFYPAVPERSPSTAMSAEYRNSTVSQWWRWAILISAKNCQYLWRKPGRCCETRQMIFIKTGAKRKRHGEKSVFVFKKTLKL